MGNFVESELNPTTVIDIKNVVAETATRISARRASIGLPPIDGVEVKDRSLRFVAMSDSGVRLWNSPTLVANRQTELDLHPSVRQFSVDCEDGRIGRAKKGAMPGLKTEHGHVSLQRSPSDGLWYPSDITIQMGLEDKGVVPQEILRVHNRGCAAWGLVENNVRAGVWDYVTPEQKQRILEISRREPALGNAIFSELTSGSGINRYYQQVHGLERPVRIATTVIYDLYTTGVELLSPLVEYDRNGSFKRIPEPSEVKRLSTSGFSQALREYKEVSNDPDFPEPGKFKDDYYTPDRFPDFSTELTNMTVALSTGKVARNGRFWIAPQSLIDMRQRMVDAFIIDGYQDMPRQLQEALVHKYVHAGVREYLLEGQIHTHKHQELHGSASSDGSNIGKYSPAYQTIRIHCPDPINGERRMMVGSTVMDRNGIDGENPHVFFIVGKSASEARRLYAQLVARPAIEDLITLGRIFPIGGVLDSRGMFLSPLQQSVRAL